MKTFLSIIERDIVRFCKSNPSAEPAEIAGQLMQAASDLLVRVGDFDPNSDYLPLLITSMQKQVSYLVTDAATHLVRTRRH